jgi:hypothetical protein
MDARKHPSERGVSKRISTSTSASIRTSKWKRNDLAFECIYDDVSFCVCPSLSTRAGGLLLSYACNCSLARHRRRATALPVCFVFQTFDITTPAQQILRIMLRLSQHPGSELKYRFLQRDLSLSVMLDRLLSEQIKLLLVVGLSLFRQEFPCRQDVLCLFRIVGVGRRGLRG